MLLSGHLIISYSKYPGISSELVENEACRTLIKIISYTIGFLLLVRCLNLKYTTFNKQQFSLHLFLKDGFLTLFFFFESLPSGKT